MAPSRVTATAAAGVAAVVGGAAFVSTTSNVSTGHLRASQAVASSATPSSSSSSRPGVEASVVVAGAALALMGRKATAPTVKQLVRAAQ
ncbi:unnamed protein product [Cladocopium goreaui]|uniref:Uncharacterized protein n=1 Tax=Cladocopium goreaui TaxID=2562237 RepID=A0A9P1DBM6_9DINO|nr:unnamed protein product [Cladocopium goreaui]